MGAHLTDKAHNELNERFDADDRMWQLMDIICAEFESDITSRQCFDQRIVSEAIALVKKRKVMGDPFNPFKKKPKETK